MYLFSLFVAYAFLFYIYLLSLLLLSFQVPVGFRLREHRWGGNILTCKALVVSLVLSKELQLFQILFPLTSFQAFLSGWWWRRWCCYVGEELQYIYYIYLFLFLNRQIKTQAKNCHKTWRFEEKNANIVAKRVPVNTQTTLSLSPVSLPLINTHTYTCLPQLQHTHIP